MSFKKMIFVLTITVSAIFLLMFGSSYAYYVSDADINLNINTGDFDADVAVVFNQSQYINLKTGIPITEEEISDKASKSNFTLVPNSSVLEGHDVSVTISLTDISIDEELRASDFRYNLSCNGGSGEFSLTPDNMGTGEDFTEDVIDSGDLVLGTISTDDNFDVNNTYACTLTVYLLENQENQNHLMNKNFSARIKINSSFRK